MNAYTATEKEGTELADRDVRALTEYMLVDQVAPGIFHVYGQGGDQYTVDLEGGACSCPDAEYRAPENGCKHFRRCQFHTGEREIPAWADRGALDPLLRDHLAEADADTPELVADGSGEIIEAGDEGVVLSEDGVAISTHYEPVEQGGAKYWRCESCGAETVMGADQLLHADVCPGAERGGR